MLFPVKLQWGNIEIQSNIFFHALLSAHDTNGLGLLDLHVCIFM